MVAIRSFLKNCNAIIVSCLVVIFLNELGGFDGADVNWECQGNLPAGLRLSRVVVGCEGYDYPHDPYILRGSCQVIVTLLGDDNWRSRTSSQRSSYNSRNTREPTSLWSIFLFLGLLYVLYQIFQHFQTQQIPYQNSSASAYPTTGQQWSNPAASSAAGGWGLWSGLGWLGLFGSMFSRR